MRIENLLPRNTFNVTMRRATEQLREELDTVGALDTSADGRHHVGGLLAFLSARPVAGHLHAELPAERYDTAVWLTGEIGFGARAELVGDRCRIDIPRPTQTLACFGYRVSNEGGIWTAEGTRAAAIGICRGALHASAAITTDGLYVSGPDSLAMATIKRSLQRVGIDPVNTPDSTMARISGPNVAAALAALRLPETAASVRRGFLTAEQRRLEPCLPLANERRAQIAAARHVKAVAALDARELPAELAEAVELRRAHPLASLAELAAKATPPISKDTYAGRLRRALARTAA